MSKTSTPSKTAYERAKKTVAPTHESLILTAIEGVTCPGMYPDGVTNYEIAAHTGVLNNVQVARRMAGKEGLEGRGLVERGPDRYDKTAKQDCETWRMKRPDPPPEPAVTRPRTSLFE